MYAFTPSVNSFVFTQNNNRFSFLDLFQAINIFGDKRNKEAAEKLAKEQELQKVHVKKEDIEVIVSDR